ncbi:DUF4150 domain-containing protein [Rhodovulum strictum]|uniref:DUF4150 domain-containing protein n=1 Tax=Rhodovulum strictum TaxID=58314 RepID=UPI001FEC0277|nr:DUF4150 domain-containing protein [Rhodovulum strictum]
MGDVFANGLEISGKAVQAQTIAAFPDVCMTPPENPATPPGVPVPYPNFAMAGDTENGTSTVFIKGKTVNLKNKSDMSRTSGDEAGCAAKKGVITSKNTGKSYFNSWSPNVKFEGEPVVRFSDLTTNNHASPAANTPPQIHTAKPAASGTAEPPKCLCGQHGAIKDECGKRDPKSEAHHVIPDRVYRANVKGQKNLVQYRVKGAPRYSEGIAICIPKSKHIAKRGPKGQATTVHHHLDDNLTRIGAAKSPPHVAPVGEIRLHAVAALGELVPDPLSMECFQEVVLKVFAQTDPIRNKQGRTSKDKLTAGSPGLAVMQKQGLG